MSNLIVFDLDGVITSEEAYWDAAGLTVHELLYSPRYWDVDGSTLGAGEQDKEDRQYRPAATAEESRCISRAILPEPEILALKARAINSNWDVCYAAVCLRLINLLALLPEISALLPLRPWDAGWLAAFRKQIARIAQGQPYVAEWRKESQGEQQGDHKGYTCPPDRVPLLWTREQQQLHIVIMILLVRSLILPFSRGMLVLS